MDVNMKSSIHSLPALKRVASILQAVLKEKNGVMNIEEIAIEYEVIFLLHFDRNLKYREKRKHECINLSATGIDNHCLLPGRQKTMFPEIHLRCLKLKENLKKFSYDVVTDGKRIITARGLRFKAQKRLDLSELGFSSIYELLSCLKDVFKIEKCGDQFLLTFDNGVEISPASKSLREHEGFLKYDRSLPIKTRERLTSLLQEEFPSGLEIEEVTDAYKGLYGASLSDLNPEQYGYRSLKMLLESHPDIVNIMYCNGAIWVFSSQVQFTDQAMDCFPYPIKAVSVGSSYRNLNRSSLLSVDSFVDVMVAEVFSPERFWFIHRGTETSESLESMMDSMVEFYSGKLGCRYKVPPDLITVGAPVAVLETNDNNYYRALITSIEDLTTVKVFFVDYGSISRSDFSNLRLLHESFFDFPAQAIKACLDDVKPPNGRRLWPRGASEKFLQLVAGKGVIAHIKAVKDSVYVDIWDTNGKADLNLADVLTIEGLAVRSFDKPLDDLVPESSTAIANGQKVLCKPKSELRSKKELKDHPYGLLRPYSSNVSQQSSETVNNGYEVIDSCKRQEQNHNGGTNDTTRLSDVYNLDSLVENFMIMNINEKLQTSTNNLEFSKYPSQFLYADLVNDTLNEYSNVRSDGNGYKASNNVSSDFIIGENPAMRNVTETGSVLVRQSDFGIGGNPSMRDVTETRSVSERQSNGSHMNKEEQAVECHERAPSFGLTQQRDAMQYTLSSKLMSLPPPPGFEHMAKVLSPHGFEHLTKDQSPTGFEHKAKIQSPTGFEHTAKIQSPTGFEHTAKIQSPTGFEHTAKIQSPTGFEHTAKIQSPTGFEHVTKGLSPTGIEHLAQNQSLHGCEYLTKTQCLPGSQHLGKGQSPFEYEYLSTDQSSKGGYLANGQFPLKSEHLAKGQSPPKYQHSAKKQSSSGFEHVTKVQSPTGLKQLSKGLSSADCEHLTNCQSSSRFEHWAKDQSPIEIKHLTKAQSTSGSEHSTNVQHVVANSRFAGHVTHTFSSPKEEMQAQSIYFKGKQECSAENVKMKEKLPTENVKLKEELPTENVKMIDLVNITGYFKLHILLLYGKPYVLVDELSSMMGIKDVDEFLRRQEVVIPKICIGMSTDKDLYSSLHRLGSRAIYHENSLELRPFVSAYTLQDIPVILDSLGFDDEKLNNVLKILNRKYGQDGQPNLKDHVIGNGNNLVSDKDCNNNLKQFSVDSRLDVDQFVSDKLTDCVGIAESNSLNNKELIVDNPLHYIQPASLLNKEKMIPSLPPLVENGRFIGKPQDVAQPSYVTSIPMSNSQILSSTPTYSQQFNSPVLSCGLSEIKQLSTTIPKCSGSQNMTSCNLSTNAVPSTSHLYSHPLSQAHLYRNSGDPSMSRNSTPMTGLYTSLPHNSNSCTIPVPGADATVGRPYEPFNLKSFSNSPHESFISNSHSFKNISNCTPLVSNSSKAYERMNQNMKLASHVTESLCRPVRGINPVVNSGPCISSSSGLQQTAFGTNFDVASSLAVNLSNQGNSNAQISSSVQNKTTLRTSLGIANSVEVSLPNQDKHLLDINHNSHRFNFMANAKKAPRTPRWLVESPIKDGLRKPHEASVRSIFRE